MARILSKDKVRFNPAQTVEHPFDTHFIPAQPDSDWVKLVDTTQDEYALLQCPYSETEWVVWLPSSGEAILHQDQLQLAA